MDYRYEASGAVVSVRVEPAGDAFAVTIDGQTYTVRVSHPRPGAFLLAIEGEPQQRVHIAAAGPQRWVALPGAPAAGPFTLTVPAAATRRRASAAGHDMLTAQMPSVVRQVLVAPGDAVERGQVLVLLEAMKMEIRLTAPHAGTVTEVAVAVGQAIERGQTLIAVES